MCVCVDKTNLHIFHSLQKQTNKRSSKIVKDCVNIWVWYSIINVLMVVSLPLPALPMYDKIIQYHLAHLLCTLWSPLEALWEALNLHFKVRALPAPPPAVFLISAYPNSSLEHALILCGPIRSQPSLVYPISSKVLTNDRWPNMKITRLHHLKKCHINVKKKKERITITIQKT